MENSQVSNMSPEALARWENNLIATELEKHGFTILDVQMGRIKLMTTHQRRANDVIKTVSFRRFATEKPIVFLRYQIVRTSNSFVCQQLSL